MTMALFGRLWRRTRATQLRFLNRIWPPPDPYTTHLPVLVGLARLFPVRRVLELGSGRFSTLAFLDRGAFPDLTELVSCETDAAWLIRVRELVGADPRVEFVSVVGPMSDHVSALNLTGFDLVFVDDSDNTAARAATLSAVLGQKLPRGFVTAHDMENQAYRDRVPAHLGRHPFASLVPNTWAIWGETLPVTVEQLERLARVIRRYARRIPPANWAAWAARFAEEFPQPAGVSA